MEVCLMRFLTDIDFRGRDVEKLRGYISRVFSEEVLLHNHLNDYKFMYRMPKIQYKLIENKLCVLGFQEGTYIIKNKLQYIKELHIDNKVIRDYKIELEVSDDSFDVQDELYSYEFLTPWLALNQENFNRYMSSEFDLNKQMQNNILSNFKDCGMQVEKRIIAKGEFKPLKVVMKDTSLIGFKGSFVCNVKMPNYMGIGKRKSIGYGTIILR